MKTVGEQTFESYLDASGIRYEFEKLPPGKSRPPDYTIQHDREYLLEVKDFEPTEVSDEEWRERYARLKAEKKAHGEWYDGYKRIRAKIDSAAKKFNEYEGWPCALILYNNGDLLVELTDPDFVLGAMYGDAGIVTHFDPKTGEATGEECPAFLGRGKMIRPHWKEPENTRISALVTLRYVHVGHLRYEKLFTELKTNKTGRVERAVDLLRQLEKEEIDFDREEKHLGVMVWENVFAAVPFSRDLFNGDYDEIYGAEGGRLQRVFAGVGVRAYEELKSTIKTQTLFEILKKKQ